MRTRVCAYAAGSLLLLLGTVGFVVTGFSGLFETHSEHVLLGLRLNPALNLVHLALGSAWLRAGASAPGTTRAATGLVAALVLLLGLLGLWLTGRPDLNVLAVNTAAAAVHLTAGGLGLLAMGLPARRPTRI